MTKIVHFGPGNFFRAHLAEYTADTTGWTITAVSLRSSTFRDVWQAGQTYTLLVHGQDTRAIDVISEVLVAPEDPKAVFDALCDPDTQVISATVTEKGYHLDAKGMLDLSSPEIAADVKSGTPTTLIGYLAHGLARRALPVTVLSCDNRVGNGYALSGAVQDFARAAGLHITCAVTFPNSMVDRITPATTQELIDQTDDPLVVACEPFKEWVIEDRFAGETPGWPGVQWVDDVAPHELRKLRMLNGAHSFLAYAGVLAGHTYVHQAIADPVLRKRTTDLMAEAAETLPDAVQGQVTQYAKDLLTRFQNPEIRHELRQIAMDGSQKLLYRCIAVLRARGAARAPANLNVLRVWIDVLRADIAQGVELHDPRAHDLRAATTDADFLAVVGAEDLSDALG